MFRKKNQELEVEDRLRVMEGLVSFCSEIIDMYHQGIGPRALEPMTPGLAKMMIADEIHRQLGGAGMGGEHRYARLRINGSDQSKILCDLDDVKPGCIVTTRWLGPREQEDETVLYATIRCDSAKELADIIMSLEEKGMGVRDGTFGLFLR